MIRVQGARIADAPAEQFVPSEPWRNDEVI